MQPQQNDLLCRVENDAPMGRLMRQHWMPACMIEEIAERPNVAPPNLEILPDGDRSQSLHPSQKIFVPPYTIDSTSRETILIPCDVIASRASCRAGPPRDPAKLMRVGDLTEFQYTGYFSNFTLEEQ